MQVYFVLSLLDAVSFPSSLKIPVAELSIVTPLSNSSTPGETALRMQRSATYQEHTVQIMKLVKWAETRALSEKLANRPLKSHPKITFFLAHPTGKKVTFGIASLVPGFFFFPLLHSSAVTCRGKNTHTHTSPVVNNVIYWLIFPDPDIDAASAMMLLNTPPEIQAGCE